MGNWNESVFVARCYAICGKYFKHLNNSRNYQFLLNFPNIYIGNMSYIKLNTKY